MLESAGVRVKPNPCGRRLTNPRSSRTSGRRRPHRGTGAAEPDRAPGRPPPPQGPGPRWHRRRQRDFDAAREFGVRVSSTPRAPSRRRQMTLAALLALARGIVPQRRPASRRMGQVHRPRPARRHGAPRRMRRIEAPRRGTAPGLRRGCPPPTRAQPHSAPPGVGNRLVRRRPPARRYDLPSRERRSLPARCNRLHPNELRRIPAQQRARRPGRRDRVAWRARFR